MATSSSKRVLIRASLNENGHRDFSFASVSKLRGQNLVPQDDTLKPVNGFRRLWGGIAVLESGS